MDMLYRYKEAFSLRDEIETCPNIEVEIDVIDKMPFFIKPYQEDKQIVDKEMKRLQSPRYIKIRLFLYMTLRSKFSITE